MSIWLPVLLRICLTAIAANPTEITVYTYDSFSGKGSLGAYLRDHSEKKIGVRTKFVEFGSAGEALNQIAIEGKKTRADIVVGIDQNLAVRAMELGAFVGHGINGANLVDGLKLDQDNTLLPFDYGYLAFVYDRRRTTKVPASLEALSTDETLRKKVVIEDPRTSSLGLSFLAWTKAANPTDAAWESFWRRFAPQLVTVSPSWSAAYGLFLKKEAEFVLSYTTSPAYHLKEEKTEEFRAAIFPEGHLRQVEGAGIVKYGKHTAAARKWLGFLLSEEVQKEVAERQWMYPARKGIALPESFSKLGPEPKAVAEVSLGNEETKRATLRKWTQWATSPTP